MADQSYTSRRELDQYGFHPAVTLLAPLVCILLQVMLPKTLPVLAVLDLPLIATIFFALARRNPVSGTVTGTLIGLLQDGLTNHPFGVNGIAKGIIGYIAASIGFVVDVENVVNRIGLNFGLCLLQSALLYMIFHLLLGDPTYAARPAYELLRAVVNSLVSVPVFYLLDRFKMRGE
jgi:rod shape-determining protein MreD